MVLTASVATVAYPAYRAERVALAWMPEVVLGSPAVADQAELPLATAGVLRYVWHSRYGDMLIEVVDGQVFVNGGWVQPHAG